MKRCGFVAVLVLTLAAGMAWAQESIDESRPAAPDGVVEIDNISGTVDVIGWDRNEVKVTGTLGRGTERLEFEGDRHRTRVRVVLPHHHGRDVEASDLEVRVPAGSRVEVETVSADISAQRLTGRLDLESVSGDIDVEHGPGELEVSSVSGTVTVDQAPEGAEIETISGAIVIHGANGSLQAASVSGRISVDGGVMRSGDFETVSGSIRCAADLVGRGTFDFETMSGTVTLIVPRSIVADFELSTFSGHIANEIGPQPERTSRFAPGKEASFSTGSGGPRVSITSFSGSVRLETR